MTMYAGLSSLAIFRLLTHALFKAVLFMCAGGVIHFMGNSKNIRFVGSSHVCVPFTSPCLMISNSAVCGKPFFGWVLF